MRSRLVTERTNLINQLRAILLERGVTFPVGRRKLELGVDGLLAEAVEVVSPRVRQLVDDLRAEWKALDTKIEALNTEFIQLACSDAAMRRLTSIPGIGMLNATALVTAVGDASSFKRARDLGAWLGLVPDSTAPAVNPRPQKWHLLPTSLLGSERADVHLGRELAHETVYVDAD